MRRLVVVLGLLLSLSPSVASAGDARFHGSLGATPLNRPIVAMATTPSGDGYWLVASDGGVFTFGDAEFFGSTGAIPLRSPIVGVAPSPSGGGYWLVAADGGVFAFGDAQFHGAAVELGARAVALVPTDDGDGYWIVGESGRILASRGAPEPTPVGSRSAPVVGAAAGPGDGLWMATTAGEVIARNGAVHHGDLKGRPLNQAVVGIAPTPSGRGYWLVARDGGIFAFGDAEFFGSTGAMRLNRPIVGMASSPDAGYWFVASDGGVFTFGPRTRTAPAAGCTMFPADNPWNTDISGFPVHARSDAWVASIGRDDHLHPDFGTFWDGAPIGIPHVAVGADQARVDVTFEYADESDHGTYPIPRDAPIEGGPSSDGDRHVLVLHTAECRLYELFDAHPQPDGSWHAGSGAIFDLRSNERRPDGWTSADAAGLPILPGLVRYDEVAAGEIRHALRFTISRTQRGYIHPATHFASSITSPDVPPMGARFRMKASYDCSWASREVQVICAAMKRYGMFVADNGSDWYVSGDHDPRWDDDALGDLKRVPGSAFEAVDTGPVRN